MKVIILLYFSLLSLLVSQEGLAASPETYQVLILHSYSRDSVWTDKIDTAIKRNLKASNKRLITYTEYMDTKRFYSTRYLSKLKSFYYQKYKDLKINLIITSDDNAFHFAMNNRKRLFNNAGIVFTGLNSFNDKRFEQYRKVGGYTGIIEIFKIKETLKMALNLHPHAKKVYILNTIHSNTGQYLKSEFQKVIGQLNLKQEVVYLEDYKIDDLYRKLPGLDKDSFALFASYSRDRDGIFLNFEKNLAKMASYSNIPIYGFLKYYLPYGLTGGYFTSGEVYGKEAAILANKVIDGGQINDLKIISNAPTPIVFDYRKIVKYDIDISLLPKNVQIINQINKLQQFYQDYTVEFWIILFSFSCLVISVFVLFYYFNQQKKHKKEVLRINEELEERVEKRTHQLIEQQSKLINSAKLASIGEMASGIAHEINNPLTIIDLSAHRIRQNADNESVENSAIKIKDTVSRITKIIKGLKQLAKEDHSLNGELVNIQEAIDDVISICQTKFRENEIDFMVDIDKDLEVTGGAVQISQVILNLLNNAFDELVTTNNKRWVKLEGRRDKKFVEISVTDSGAGIPEDIQDKIMEPFFTTKVEKKGTGLGLSICKNIIEHHRGRLFVDTSSSNTKFVIQIPAPL